MPDKQAHFQFETRTANVPSNVPMTAIEGFFFFPLSLSLPFVMHNARALREIFSLFL